jgi:multidrug efflux pump subunit AcrA (membrane-fusion protein)
MSTLKTLTAALATAREARDAADAEVARIQAEIRALEATTARAAMEKKIAGLRPEVVEALRGEPCGALVKNGFCMAARSTRHWTVYRWTTAGELAREILGVTT